MTSRPFHVLLALLLCGGLLMAALRAQTPEEVQKQAEEEQRQREALMPADALERNRMEHVDLLGKQWEQGDVERLSRMHPDEIVKMQVVGLVWNGDEAKHVRCGLPFGVGKREELKGVLALVKAAGNYEPHGDMEWGVQPDRALVVQPWRGEPFEIHYESALTAPFGDRDSRPLKDALYALSGGQHRITIVHLDEGKIERVMHTYAIAPHLGGHSTDWLDAELHLTAEKGLTLFLRVHTGVEDLMKDEQPMRYGEGKIFQSDGRGTWIVVLDIPDEHWEAVASEN
jgi:hypothetical protein